MDVILPTSKLLKAQRQYTDRLVAAGSRESVEAAIVSTQQRQSTKMKTTTKGLTTVAKIATDATAYHATAFLRERGIVELVTALLHH